MRSIVLIVVLLISAPAGAQRWSDTGLETANYKHVAVLVEGLTGADAGSMGLTKDRIQTRVELRLRSAGLIPGKASSKSKTYLYVLIGVVRKAHSISVRYRRGVSFITGDQQYRKSATTWNVASVGTHGGEAAYIINALDKYLDEFLNEYLKVNQK